MLPSSIIAALSNSATSPLWLIVVLVIAYIGLIPFDNWFRNTRAARIASSIRELEALFALKDCRPAPSHRPYRRS